MSPLAVFFRTLSRSSAICLGIGLAIVNPAFERSASTSPSRVSAPMAFDRRHRAEQPERGRDRRVDRRAQGQRRRRPPPGRNVARRNAQPARRAGTDRSAQGSAGRRQVARRHGARRARRHAGDAGADAGAQGCRAARPRPRGDGPRRNARSRRRRAARSRSSATATSTSGARRSWRSARSATRAPSPP